jgi:hypothetical protein
VLQHADLGVSTLMSAGGEKPLEAGLPNNTFSERGVSAESRVSK